MGVESGPSGATGAISAAPSGISLGNGLEFGPALGIADIGPIVNEGPVSFSGLENTMPYILDTGKINTFSFAKQIIAEPQAALVVEQGGANLISEVPDVFQTAFADINLDPAQNDRWVIPQVEPLIVPGLDVQPAPIILGPAVDIKPNPILEEQALSSVSSQSENRISVHQAVSQVLEQPAPQEQEVEEEVIEVVKVENKEKDLEEEELETNRFVEDEQASGVRKHEIKEAIVKAKSEANRLGLKGIAGWLVARFLPAEHSGNRSQIIKENGPDGSYQETVEAIAEAGQLESEELAVKRFDLIVEEKKPVKLGKDGQKVEQQDLSRVFKYKLVKPKAEEIIVKRFIKKKVLQPFVRAVETKIETSLADFPDLEKVYQKAA